MGNKNVGMAPDSAHFDEDPMVMTPNSENSGTPELLEDDDNSSVPREGVVVFVVLSKSGRNLCRNLKPLVPPLEVSSESFDPESYEYPAAVNSQWFPWPDAFGSQDAAQRVLSYLCSKNEHVVHEFGANFAEIYTLKVAALQQENWILESISNQWYGINVIPILFRNENFLTTAFGLDGLADELSLLPADEVKINYVGNTDVSPLSFGEIVYWRRFRSSSSTEIPILVGPTDESDYFELFDLRGGQWFEVMFGTRLRGGCLQPAPQLRDVPTHITNPKCTVHVAGSFYSDDFSETTVLKIVVLDTGHADIVL